MKPQSKPSMSRTCCKRYQHHNDDHFCYVVQLRVDVINSAVSWRYMGKPQSSQGSAAFKTYFSSLTTADDSQILVDVWCGYLHVTLAKFCTKKPITNDFDESLKTIVQQLPLLELKSKGLVIDDVENEHGEKTNTYVKLLIDETNIRCIIDDLQLFFQENHKRFGFTRSKVTPHDRLHLTLRKYGYFPHQGMDLEVFRKYPATFQCSGIDIAIPKGSEKENHSNAPKVSNSKEKSSMNCSSSECSTNLKNNGYCENCGEMKKPETICSIQFENAVK